MTIPKGDIKENGISPPGLMYYDSDGFYFQVSRRKKRNDIIHRIVVEVIASTVLSA